MKELYAKVHRKFWYWTLTTTYRHAALGLLLGLIGWRLFGNWYCLIPPIAYGVAKETLDYFYGKRGFRDHAEDIASYAVGGLIAQLILYWKG
jgi:hypothetical protein